tara:strand:- start:6978 stop:7928 length:951 start_codon:yes stop_codon:yes gene_type:complete
MTNKFYELKVIRSGLLTTIQDKGFRNLQHIGITTGGAMDEFSYTLGNNILMNKINTPSIEFSQVGPKLLLEKGSINIVITGKVNFNLKINGIKQNGEVNKIYFLNKNDEINVINTQNSNYGYLSIKNGIITSSFKNTFSTLLNSKIGANNGERITINQLIKGKSSNILLNNIHNSLEVDTNNSTIRVIKGPQMNFFKIKDIKKFFSNKFKISQNINRTGIRLINNIVKPLKSFNIPSEGIVKGSIQVPGDGNPIILTNDHPTIGGYPKIATVIINDYNKLIQMQPETEFYFKETTIKEAENLYKQYIKKISMYHNK